MSSRFDALNLSYHIHPDFWGLGYATELVVATLEFAFADLGADTVIGLVRSANPASRRVLEKCGFDFVREVELHGALSNLYMAKRTSDRA
jgi:[ribosomal protein S5]-alanine N-acetyltransferase